MTFFLDSEGTTYLATRFIGKGKLAKQVGFLD